MFSLARVGMLGFLLACAVPVAHALNYQFMHRSPLSYFTEEDLEIANARAVEMLDSGVDGETYEWRNEDTGNHGSYTIRKTFEKEGRRCRTVTVHDVGGPAEMTTTHTACVESNGEWMILK